MPSRSVRCKRSLPALHASCSLPTNINLAMPNVSNLVKTIQDIMRKDAGTYGDAQRLEQLGWMFFLKIFDDREKEMELLRDNYKSPLPQHLRWSKWAADEEGITGEALLDFVNNTLLPKL